METNYFNVTEVFQITEDMSESNRIERSNELCETLIFQKSEKFHPNCDDSFSVFNEFSKPESVFLSSSDQLGESFGIEKTKGIENSEDLGRSFILSSTDGFSISDLSCEVTNKVTFSNIFDATMNFNGSNIYRKSGNLFEPRDESLYTRGFADTVWIVCIVVLFITGTFFFGWSTSLEYLLFEVKEEEQSVL
jgi:hypothetical protein